MIWRLTLVDKGMGNEKGPPKGGETEAKSVGSLLVGKRRSFQGQSIESIELSSLCSSHSQSCPL